MTKPRVQKTTSVKEKKLQDRMAKLAQDALRSDGTSIRDTDLQQYFCLGAQHLSLELVKLYVLYLARTAAGTLDERITATTIRNYIAHTLCAMYRSSGGKQKQLDTIDLRQIYAYINQLTLEGEVSTKTRAKPVATKKDLDIILALLFSDGFALKPHGVKLVLKVALYINLYVDSCSHGSDLAWGGPSIAREQKSLSLLEPL